MPKYHIRYGYLQTVTFPDDINAVPTFKEDKVKLSKDEVEFLLQKLYKFRKAKYL